MNIYTSNVTFRSKVSQSQKLGPWSIFETDVLYGVYAVCDGPKSDDVQKHDQENTANQWFLSDIIWLHLTFARYDNSLRL